MSLAFALWAVVAWNRKKVPHAALEYITRRLNVAQHRPSKFFIFSFSRSDD